MSSIQDSNSCLSGVIVRVHENLTVNETASSASVYIFCPLSNKINQNQVTNSIVLKIAKDVVPSLITKGVRKNIENIFLYQLSKINF